jgi:hypothetical protein
MIRIGYKGAQRLQIIADYRAAHPEIQTVIVFSPKRFWLPGEYEQYEWADIIMYKVFYPLLERIDSNCLIVVNECLRTQNRGDLTYNCLHHYLNQTPHRIVFEYFPFIEDTADFMILADKDHPGRYKGRGYDRHMLDDIDIEIKQHHLIALEHEVLTPEGVAEKYTEKRDTMFAELGGKDPDTIPRGLHIWCGTYKRMAIDDDTRYVARNSRFGKPNVIAYRDVSEPGKYVIVDFPHRRIDFNDFLKVSEANSFEFLTTKLPVDDYYFNNFADWINRLERFYAETSLHKQKRS